MPFLAPSNSSQGAQVVAQDNNKIASTLIRLYEDSRRDEVANGHFMSVRTVPTNDVPVITSSSTAPASDTDAASRVFSLVGRAATITTASEITLASEIDTLSGWVSGFNPGLRVRWGGDSYRLSSSAGGFVGSATNGNQDNNNNPQFPIHSSGVYSDIVLTGDVLFISGTTSSGLYFWVNDRLITTAVTPAGTGITVDASGQRYTPTTSGRQYIKLKFPTVDTRTVRIFHYAAGGLGDFYTRALHSVYPRHRKKLNWLHVSDNFGLVVNATNTMQSAPQYLATSFGTSVNMINASVGGTGWHLNTASLPNWLERWDIDLKLNKPMDVVTLCGSYGDGGRAGLAANVTSLIGKIKEAWPNCEIIAGTTVLASQVSGGTDVSDENTYLNAASAAGAAIIRTQTDPYGKWLTGNGSTASPTGLGNTDLYSNGSSPSAAGCEYWGKRWARAIYDIMRTKVGV